MAQMAKTVSTSTPAQHGFSFPPEWHPHAARGFSWPRPEGISFPGKYHEAIEDLARLIREIVAREQVHINVPNENYEHIVRELPEGARLPMRHVFFHLHPDQRSLGRDHGPAFVLRKRRGKTAGRDRRLGLQRVGRQVSAVG